MTIPVPEQLSRAAPAAAAREAGLRYLTDARPGISRRRRGSSFNYFDAEGDPVRDPDEVRRIDAIRVPPAWTDVWISPDPRGHIQATGRDAKGRKQYRYHPRYRAFRDETKFHHMVDFAEALGRIRTRVLHDLGRPGLRHEKVLAAVVELLDLTLIRVGNEEYAKANDSFGLTTLRDEHVAVKGTELRFRFRGKSGKEHHVSIRDRRLARVVQRFQDLPGEELFHWVDDAGELRGIDSGDVNDYIREVAGGDFTAKDFRTWAGTVLAATTLFRLGPPRSQRETKQNLVAAVKTVAEYLGNTPAIARKSYIHPVVIDSYVDGSLLADTKSNPPEVDLRPVAGLREDEQLVLDFLRRHVGSVAEKGAA